MLTPVGRPRIFNPGALTFLKSVSHHFLAADGGKFTDADVIPRPWEPDLCRRDLQVPTAQRRLDPTGLRAALADHVEPKDFIEAHEIRTSEGHGEWGEPRCPTADTLSAFLTT